LAQASGPSCVPVCAGIIHARFQDWVVPGLGALCNNGKKKETAMYIGGGLVGTVIIVLLVLFVMGRI
jgi:hypothetical protein